MSAVIVPTVGRMVWYRPSAKDQVRKSGDDPLAARVAGVIPQDDGKYLVNLAGDDFIGQHFNRQNVPFVQQGEEAPDCCYCEWPARQDSSASGNVEAIGGMSPHDIKGNLNTLYVNFRGLGGDLVGIKEHLDMHHKAIESLCSQVSGLNVEIANITHPVEQNAEAIGVDIPTGTTGAVTASEFDMQYASDKEPSTEELEKLTAPETTPTSTNEDL